MSNFDIVAHVSMRKFKIIKKKVLGVLRHCCHVFGKKANPKGFVVHSTDVNKHIC